MILFDTDICVELLRGNEEIIDKGQEANSEVGVSSITVAELFYGAEKSVATKKNYFLIEEFLLTARILELDFTILKKFAQLKNKLRNEGNLLADADIFIAATALEKCEKLITGNVKHFIRFEELNIENWIR